MASTQLVYIRRKYTKLLKDMNSDKITFRLGENTTWCLVESQDWVGADVYQVDCDASPSDPSCAGNGTGIEPASERMANLYSNDVVRCQYTSPSSLCSALIHIISYATIALYRCFILKSLQNS
jgi:hypothetical protein